MAINSSNGLMSRMAATQAQDGSTVYAAIQMRHGNEADMDKSKFSPAEIGVATDTKKMVVAFGPNDTKEVAFKNDLDGLINKNQGTENSGKVLVVGEDGNVTPGETPIEIDSTLTQPGHAADAKTTGDKLSSLSEDINNKFKIKKNLINNYNILYDGNGKFNTVSGEMSDDGSTWIYDYISLNVGEYYTISCSNSTIQVAFYNADKTYTSYTTMVAATASNNHTVTFQAAYPFARIISYAEIQSIEGQLEKGRTKTEYEPFEILLSESVSITDPKVLNNLLGKEKVDDYYIKPDGISSDKLSFTIETYNVLNPSKCIEGYMSSNGITINQSSSFFTSDYIEIGTDDKIVRTSVNIYSICFYDQEKSKISKSSDNIMQKNYSIPEGAKFLRITFLTLLSKASEVMIYFGELEKDFIPFRIIKRSYVEKEESKFPTDVSVVLPQQIVVCNGKTVCINHQSVLRNFDISKLISVMVALKKFDTIDYKTFIEGGKNQNGNYSISFQINWGEYISKDFDVINVDKDAGNGMTKKILFIGDSKTDANKYTQYLLDMFSDDSMNIELLGTRGSGTNKHEGRSGWSAENYVENNASRGVIEESPFWNPDTEQFDFSYYMTKNGYDSVDYVFINLGTNDSFDNFISYYHKMIDGIRSYDQNIIIGVWIPAPFATFGGYTHLDNDNQTFKMMQAVIDEFDNEENRSNKIFVVPTHMNIDTFYDFAWDDVKINQLTDAVYRVCKDQIHESNGYEHVSEVIFGYIKYFATL